MTWLESLDANYTDAILILHKGKIVYETYKGIMKPHGHHTCFSVTKSYFGMIAEQLMAEGKLDDTALVTKYVPELGTSAYADATVRNVLDMRIGIAYSENYNDPAATIWKGAMAGNSFPRPPGYDGPKSIYEFLCTLQKEGEHGADFAYKSASTDVLGWILRRVLNKPLGEMLAEIWNKLGCEEDASMNVDTHGTESAGGGLHACLRDLARFGECIRLGGVFNGNRLFSEAAIGSIRNGGVPSAFTKTGPYTIPGGA
jgi:CubicO group peptidase (beta-lactamase class C family)